LKKDLTIKFEVVLYMYSKWNPKGGYIMVHDKNDLSVKMAVNVSMMELAQMDLLVDNLFYTNRS